MPVEKPLYRENLRLIREDFPDRGSLTRDEVCQYLGISEKVLWARYGDLFGPWGRTVPVTRLANALAGEKAK
ncbi:hypothetical protein LJC20_00350 [Eubacteriales bacterium OttesenSCG-928-M02]|nr:hypothetical protein [Eubacteriales bacterium OttesenSCG-928-M02]